MKTVLVRTHTLCTLICLFTCLPALAQTDSGYVSVADSKIFYTSTGKGAPLLLVHAGLLDHTMWANQVKAFSGKFQVVTVDLPGHGKTITGKDSVLIRDIFRAVLDSFRINKASMVGLSLGSASLIDFAVEYPERINKLVLAAPGVFGWETKYGLDSSIREYFGKFMQLLESKDSTAAAEHFLHYWYDGPSRTAKQMQSPQRDYLKQLILRNLGIHRASRWPNFGVPAAIDRLENINCPVLLIYSDLDVPFVKTVVSELKKRIPNAVEREVKGAAHMINLEKAEEFNRLIKSFFNHLSEL